jgi:hypothetical protein
LFRSSARTPVRQAHSFTVRRGRRWLRWRMSGGARVLTLHVTGTIPHCPPSRVIGIPIAQVLQALPEYRQRTVLGPVVAALTGGAPSPSRCATQPPPRQPGAVHGRNARPPCPAEGWTRGLAVPGRGQLVRSIAASSAFSRAQAVGVGGTTPSVPVWIAPGVPAAGSCALGYVFGAGCRPGPSLQLPPSFCRHGVRRSACRLPVHGAVGVCPQRSTAAGAEDSTGSRPDGKSRDCS